MYAEKRPNGKWLGRYRDTEGKLRSAGTYLDKQEAINAAKRAAARQEAQSADDHAIMTFHDYFYDKWIDTARIEIKTRTDYESVFRLHIDPLIGTKRLEEITSKDVRSVTRPLVDSDHLTVAHRAKSVIGSVFNTLIEDEYLSQNPAHGVRLPAPKRNQWRTLDPEDFKKIVEYLPNPGAKFFATFLVGSGLRFGEATALKTEDFDPTSRELHVRRRVSRTNLRHSDDGTSRHIVQEGTKNGKTRVVPLSEALAQELGVYLMMYGIANDEWLFPRRALVQEMPLTVVLGESWTNGLYAFTHGTEKAYKQGKCRCNLCVTAHLEHKRQERANEGRALRPARDKTGILTWEQWTTMWKNAVKDAGMTWTPRTHDLRHAHATILLSSGVDIYEVQQRLGHSSISTTEVYLHRVQSMQSKAAEASDVFLGK